MSDEEDNIIYVKKQKTIHYGSLEDSERARQTKASEAEEFSSSAQIHISSDYFDIDQEV